MCKFYDMKMDINNARIMCMYIYSIIYSNREQQTNSSFKFQILLKIKNNHQSELEYSLLH